MKLLVETKGPFQLFDIAANQMVAAHRPSVAVSTHLIQERTARGQVRVLHELKDEATDEAFLEVYQAFDGDRRAAIDAFLSEFGIEATEDEDTDTDAAETPRRTRGRRRKAAAE